VQDGTRTSFAEGIRYIEMAQKLGVTHATELTDAVVHEIAQSVQARPLPEASDAWLAIEPHRAQIEKWIGEGLRLTRMHALLVRSGATDVTYATLRRFAMRELGWHKKEPTVRVADAPPGQEAQIDFAEMGRVVDIDGRARRLWVLIVTLGASRYSFVWPTFSQTTHAVIEALEAAWKFFGGMPKTLVPDNTSAIIVGADPTSPKLNAVFAEYTQARGIFVDTERTRPNQLLSRAHMGSRRAVARCLTEALGASVAVGYCPRVLIGRGAAIDGAERVTLAVPGNYGHLIQLVVGQLLGLAPLDRGGEGDADPECPDDRARDDGGAGHLLLPRRQVDLDPNIDAHALLPPSSLSRMAGSRHETVIDVLRRCSTALPAFLS
jgi:hypothetical protein